ncbi:MAG: helix-turn-helix transcriptional regulator [Actinobacteria bacterium]|nr:helix-turn-helix transcriptional regulator [Actinomycetota bacterium]
MTYDNRQRQEAARATRARIIDAARTSFLSRGFGGTTIRQIADAAGVSQETIYKTFGGKAALLKSVYDVTLAGDDEAVPLAARPEALAVRDATSPAAAAAAYAGLAQLISSRIDPLLRVLLGSRDTDTALAEFARTTERERHVGSTFYVRQWEQAGWLRDDITTEQAVDSVWALNSPQPRWLLLDHGWSEEQFTQWLADLICHAIFRPQDDVRDGQAIDPDRATSARTGSRRPTRGKTSAG